MQLFLVFTVIVYFEFQEILAAILMEGIDKKRTISDFPIKPRRTKGTVSFTYRNYFASAVLGVGILIGIGYMVLPASSGARKYFYDNMERSEESKLQARMTPFVVYRKSKNIIMDKSKDKKERHHEDDNVVEKFLNSKNVFNDSSSCKKQKLDETCEDPEESLKLFKNYKSRNVKSSVASNASSSNSSVTNFINISGKSKLQKAPALRVRRKQTSKKKLSQQEKIFNYVVTENCLQEGIDPEEMQLAIALSESMKANEKESNDESLPSKFENPFANTGKVQPIGSMLERFGFKCKKTYSEYELDLITCKGNKRSKFQKFPTVLTRTSDEKRKESIRNKIEYILSQNSTLASDNENSDDGNSHYEVFSFNLQDFHENNGNSVFKINNEGRLTANILLDYYVTDLFTPSFLKADHLLKSWNEIPGREHSPEKIVVEIYENIPEASMNSPEVDTSSCADLFADIVENENVSECPVLLADHLEDLQSKLSNSAMCIDTNDDTDDIKSQSEIPKTEEVLDLKENSTRESTIVAEIPYDDSYYTLKHRIETLDNNRKNELVEIDLVSSEEENNLIKETSNEISDSDQLDDFKTSQNSSHDDDVIVLSDEEINYSIKNHIQNSQSIELDDNEDSIDLTQNEERIEEVEIINQMDKSLIDVMDCQDTISINETVLNLLETSFIPHNIKHVNDELSESIEDIMQKYDGDIDTKKNSRCSFQKIKSASQIVNEKQNKSVRFSLVDEENNINKSFHQSQENVFRTSLVMPTKLTTKQQRKKSLGINIDDDYFIDIETFFPEPEFENMNVVELKRELSKLGMRALPTRKATEVLKSIYEQIHPKIQVKTVEEIDKNDSRFALNFTDIVTNIGIQEQDDFIFQLDELEDEICVLPKIRKSKVHSCVIPLHISFYNMVRSSKKLQKFILEFRPVELDQIHKHFRKFGLSYQPNDIIGFLDRRCITFKTKDKSYSKVHERKKQKRATQKSQR
ncbi:CLUMA_CG014094, isoform A [Clunio marinus]|uniref:Structure-specific endonuclease subunit SLX4 n=1 Tax=Clunio marinus TaxID=568069 RepID=A0A1J1IKU5_9DIPT|nr:CLUMA_CG014094, isoform A [Clunio marinus]